MSRNSKILLLVTLACMNLALLVYIGFGKSKELISPASLQKELDALPSVEMVDDAGRRFRLDGLTGRASLVQFINPRVASQLEAASKVAAAFGGSEASFILITKDTRELRARLPGLPEHVLVVQHDYAGLKEVFNVPACCERRFIFNAGGKLHYKDYYYEIDLRPRLRSLLNPALQQDYPASLAGALKSVSAGRFASLREQTRGGKPGNAVVIIFESVSTSCPSGELVKAAKRFSAAHKDVPLIVLLPGGYTPADVENLKANLRADFSVERADPTLSEKLSPLGASTGKVGLTAR